MIGRGGGGTSTTVSGSATLENDHVTLSGANTDVSSGSFTFNLYPEAPSGRQCNGRPVFTSTKTLSPLGDADFSFPADISSSPVPTTLAPGTYYWTVSYSGDLANQPSTSPCGSETLTVAPFSISAQAAVVSTQTLALTMSCTAPLCTVRITVTRVALLAASDARQKAKRKPPVATLARGTVTIRRGAKTVRLQLTPAGRKFVASHNGQVPVDVAVAMTIAGHRRVVNQHIRLKIKKASKRKQP